MHACNIHKQQKEAFWHKNLKERSESYWVNHWSYKSYGSYCSSTCDLSDLYTSIWPLQQSNLLTKKIKDMKIFSLLLVAGFIAGSGFLAETDVMSGDKKLLVCGDQNVSDTLPPAKIQSSFTTKYPNATSVKWYRYTAPTTKMEPGYWYSTLDGNDYYVSFNWNDVDYIAWYDNENWVYSTHHIGNTELPIPVSQAIVSQYPGFAVIDVDMEHDSKQELYEVKLQKGYERWNVHFTPEGTVFKKKQRDLKQANAEVAIVSDFETRYPTATAATWYKYDPYDRVEVLPTDWNYKMDADDYEVVFTSDGSNYIAYYDNGNWVRTESYWYDRSSLPTVISNAISTQYAGYTIKDVSREDSRNNIVYEVELMKGNDICKIHYGADGSIVKKKCRTDGVKTKS